MTEPQTRVAIVTGANRGIGYEVSKQLATRGITVILTSRSQAKGEMAAAKLKGLGHEVHFHSLDVTRRESIEQLHQFVATRFGRLDILVNNAGVYLDTQNSALTTDLKTILSSLETNTFGPLQMCQAFVPLMKKNGYGRIVNVSSGMGQLTHMNGSWPGYRISKTALNAVTRMIAEEVADPGILVNSVCPGWVKTDMGGPDAERPVEEGAETIVWAATLPEGGPNGVFFRDREPLEW